MRLHGKKATKCNKHNFKRCRHARSLVCLQSTSQSFRVLRTKCQNHVNTATKYTYVHQIVGKSGILDVTHWPVLRNVV